ncbi:hypothetical protein HDU76_000185 [Blyttiomyces sp. JEL0837]|nr:hypothetical protein HDU76_000185 [Blyttiomyces sp. JEL0837]
MNQRIHSLATATTLSRSASGLGRTTSPPVFTSPFALPSAYYSAATYKTPTTFTFTPSVQASIPFSTSTSTSTSTTTTSNTTKKKRHIMSTRISKVLATNDSTRWIKLYELKYTDPNGVERRWESAERTTRKGEVDAVAIFPLIKTPGQPVQTILVSQYRPPIDAVVVELPAGLVDAGETPEMAAIRELHEETGYRGTVIKTTPVMVSDPGMSNANMRLVVLDIDMTLPDNQNAVPKLEDGEFIERTVVPVKGLMKTLEEYKSKGFEIDARLAHLAEGLELSTSLSL